MYTEYPCFLYLWYSWADDQYYVRQEWSLKQRLKPGSNKVQFHLLVELNKLLTCQVRSYKELCEGNGQGRQQVLFSQEVPTDKLGETQGWHIQQPSNKSTYEGTSV